MANLAASIACPLRDLPPKPPPSSESSLSNFILAVSKHKAVVIITFLSVIILSVFYIPKLEVVSNQLMFFRENSEIRQTFDKVDKYFRA